MNQGSLKKNSFFSLLISAIPAVVGIVTVPLLIRQLGLERFAFLSVVWAIIGYFGIFDLGLSRSLGKRAAARHSKKEYASLGADVGFGIIAIVALGGVVAVALDYLGAAALSNHFKIDPTFLTEAQSSIGVISWSIPVLMLLAATKGVLEGIHEFKTANYIQLINGLSNFLIPTIVSLWLPNIKSILFVLLVFRFILLIYSLMVLLRFIPLRFGKKWDRHLLTEGGWLTLAAMASPLMIYVDRLVLGTMIPLKNLAFYTTPVDLGSRIWIIPQAITRITFPAFSFLAKDPSKTKETFAEALDLMIMVCFLPLIVLFFLSHEVLQVWIGTEMADNASIILRILIIGLFINCLSWVSLSLLQATDGTLISGVVSLIEVPLYFAGLWFLTLHFGLLGAAIAWSGRLILDTLFWDIYFLFSKPQLRNSLTLKFKASLAFLILSILIVLTETKGLSIPVLSSRLTIGAALAIGLLVYYFKHPTTKQLFKLLKKR